MEEIRNEGEVIRPIAHYSGPLKEKFGLPRQAGLVSDLKGKIRFVPAFRDPQALRGLEGYSHIWLIWGFSQNPQAERFQPTVRPPRLDGNTRMGVFATRSPFRPNGLGLSCVRLLGIQEISDQGWVLEIEGADLADGTPIYDIKPYIPYADAHPEAKAGFAQVRPQALDQPVIWALDTEIPTDLLPFKNEIEDLLCQDPRPAYQDDPQRVYGMQYRKWNIKFQMQTEEIRILAVDDDV